MRITKKLISLMLVLVLLASAGAVGTFAANIEVAPLSANLTGLEPPLPKADIMYCPTATRSEPVGSLLSHRDRADTSVSALFFCYPKTGGT